MNCPIKKDKAKALFIGGIVALVLALIVVGIGTAAGGIPWKQNYGSTYKDYGIAVGMWYFIDSFKTDLVLGQSFWGNEDPLRLMIVVACWLSLTIMVLLIIVGAKGKKEHRGLVIGSGVLQFVSIVIAADLFATVLLGIDFRVLTRHGYLVLGIGIILVLIAAVLSMIAVCVKLIQSAIDAKPCQVVAAPVEEKKEEPAPVEEKKEEPKPEPEPVVEEKKEEPKTVVVEKASPVIPVSSKGRRRASFETKVKNSDADLRHKYYDLRDYIKSYGVNNRISIPGDTFSAHRERYVFITVSGKHLKVNFALDPKKYANSTTPVDANTAKKYEDLPLVFKVRSDLSFRRACSLVDDVMAAKGIAKPEPKEAAK